jgi:hypothetical protein
VLLAIDLTKLQVNDCFATSEKQQVPSLRCGMTAKKIR